MAKEMAPGVGIEPTSNGVKDRAPFPTQSAPEIPPSMVAKHDSQRWLTSEGLPTHFSLDETRCPCGCTRNDMDQTFMDTLERFRGEVGQPVRLTSAYRCDAHNRKVGGAPTSYHLTGHAADVQVKGLVPAVLAAYARNVGFHGIGNYQYHLHVDTGHRRPDGTPRVWVK